MTSLVTASIWQLACSAYRLRAAHFIRRFLFRPSKNNWITLVFRSVWSRYDRWSQRFALKKIQSPRLGISPELPSPSCSGNLLTATLLAILHWWKTSLGKCSSLEESVFSRENPIAEDVRMEKVAIGDALVEIRFKSFSSPDSPLGFLLATAAPSTNTLKQHCRNWFACCLKTVGSKDCFLSKQKKTQF